MSSKIDISELKDGWTRLALGNNRVSIHANHFNAHLTDDEKKALFKGSVLRVAVEISSLCNRACMFCPNSLGKRENKVMDLGLYARILEDLAGINYNGTLMYHLYNEPLLNPDLLKYLSMSTAAIPDASRVLFTNGDYLDKQMLDAIAETGVAFIQVNIYGPNNGEFDLKEIEERIYKIHEKLGLSCGKVVWDAGQHYRTKFKYKSCDVTIDSKNLYKMGFDRGGLLDINKVTRKSPCFAPFTDIDIDYQGNCLLCCNIYTPSAEHDPYILGTTDTTQNLFDVYTLPKQIQWRKKLMTFSPNFKPCAHCGRQNCEEFVFEENETILRRCMERLEM